MTVADRLLHAVAGDELAQQMLGDLHEESDDASWRRRQILRSLPSIIAGRLVARTPRARLRLLALAASVAMGLLQSWDSDVFQAPAGIIALVVAAVALPSLTALIFDHPGVQVAGTVIAFTLLTVGRVISPIPHPELHLVAFFSGMLLLLFLPAMARKRDDGDGESPA